MQFEYTGRHVEVTPSIRSHVEDHFGKLGHIFENSSTARAHVVIDVAKNRHIAEIILTWRDHTLTATDTNADMYQALTRVIDKIEKQALKMKKKIIERKQNAQPLSALATDAGAAEATDGDADAADASAPGQPRIINARGYRVKPMTAEEAAMSLSEDANQFLVFRDADNDRVSVLYKRKDGNYGLIQP
ncbi:MAG TPA: ribosome-associated translation inhibitor RaiA [Pyrinomonadaceae bacterium]|jgi:putative sigma-54 modulation protein|nr:ribosome-associated translation inhibitor RaiA [Pyrinomonadaceae bacterium]